MSFVYFNRIKSNIKNLGIDTDGLKVRWGEFRRIEFNIENPDSMMIKYDFDRAIHLVRLQPNLRKSSQLPKLYPLFGDAD